MGDVGDAKIAAFIYHDSGAYARDLAGRADEAARWISDRGAKVSQSALCARIEIKDLRQNSRWVPFGNAIRFNNIMGHYKGRVQLRQRKKRFAKDQRIKALADSKKGTTPPPSRAADPSS
jgi:hypothetical protein